MAISAASNTLITPTIIAKEALMMLSNNLVMGKLVHREYVNEFKKVGTSINIRKPVKFSVTTAAQMTKTDVVEYNEAFSVATQQHVAWGFNSVELTMTVEEYSKRYIAPAALALANSVDYALTGLYNDVGQYSGTPGTTPSAYSDLGDAQTTLDDAACPMQGRVAVLNPTAHWTLADGLKGTFAAKPANDIHTKGYLGTVAHLDMHMDQNIRRHTTGIFTTSASPLTNGVSVDGDYHIDTDGWNASTSTLTAGDVLTVASVYSVNPVNGVSTGVLKRFVNLNLETADSSGDIVVDIMSSTSEGLQDSGGYKNISAHIGSGAVITLLGTESTEYPQNLIFHPNAFGLVTMPLAMPANVWGARVTDKQMALSIRVIKDYNILEDEEIIRLDILYGVSTLYPELAVRLQG